MKRFKAISIGSYFLMSSYYAIQNGCVGMTWDGETQRVFESCCGVLTSGTSNGNRLRAKRELVKNRLGEVILKDQVPDVSNLPIEEVLEIRRKREAELKSFRDGLRQLAADIGPTLDDHELVLSLDTKLHKVVRPALNNLRASISELQIEAYRRLYSPDNSLVAGGVTFAISSLAGMPAGLPLNLGAVGVLVSKLYDFTIGKHLKKKKLLVSSPWSVFFHLNKRTINKRY